MKIIAFNKPFAVLTQFTANNGEATLADYITIPDFYVAGRLDKDSEGLVILTDHGPLQARISEPKHKMSKTYWVQVEGIPTEEALSQLRKGVTLKDGLTRPCEVALIPEPQIWPRVPPVRQRKLIPTSWLELTIKEGRNRQVRRMTANVGYPTLRLIRAKVGPWALDELDIGEWRWDSVPNEVSMSLKKHTKRKRK